VSVIDTATNVVTATIAVGTNPEGIAVTPDNSKVYVANAVSNNVSVIDAATNTVLATITIGPNPHSYPWSRWSWRSAPTVVERSISPTRALASSRVPCR